MPLDPAIARIIAHGYTRITGGIDLGSLKETAHTTAAYLTMEILPDLLVTFAEYNQRGLASDDVFEWVFEMQAKWKPEKWWSSAEQNRANQFMRKGGVPVDDAARYQGARDDGIAMIKRLLSVEMRSDGTHRPGLYVTEDCPKLINAIEVYKGERKDDDEVDAFRYCIMCATKGRLKATRSEVSVKRSAGDMLRRSKTSRMMTGIRAERRARLERHLSRLG
jgi:hypothetical protein